MKVLIVEDEQLTREALAGTLNRFGYPDILEAGDGLEALDLFARFSPDVILADVKMPRMDGIQLLSELRAANHPTVFIILSSYDLFEYARKAVEYGAFSYLLKPVKDEELRQCLAQAEKSILRTRAESDKNILTGLKAKKYMELAKKQLVERLVESDSEEEASLTAALAEVGISFRDRNFLIAAAQMDNLEELTRTASPEDIQLLQFSVENISCEHLSEQGIPAYPFNLEGGQGFLINLPDSSPTALQELKSLFHRIRESVHTCMGITLTIGIGSVVPSLSRLHLSLEAARKAVMSRLTDGGNTVYLYSAGAEPHPAEQVLIDYETEQKLLLSFEKGDSASALGIMEGLYRLNSTSPNHGKYIMKLNFQLIFILFRFMAQAGVNPEQLLGSEFKIYNQLNACSSLDSMLEVHQRTLGTCFGSLKDSQQLWNKKIMAKAMEYILNNFDKEISLSMIADYVNMSPAYFSKQFKLEFNENFIDYLTKCRLNKARELLKDGRFPASEVARMVGFNDEKYFYKIFKKLVGVTPGNYRKNTM